MGWLRDYGRVWNLRMIRSFLIEETIASPRATPKAMVQSSREAGTRRNNIRALAPEGAARITFIRKGIRK